MPSEHSDSLLERVEDRDPEQLAADLRVLVPAGESVAAAVAEIIDDVRRSGDRAVARYTALHDTGGLAVAALQVAREQLREAASALQADVRAGLRHAIENVGAVARASLREQRTVAFAGHVVVLRDAPVQRAAVYVPGGRAPYPSTVVMGVVTAREAGVPEVVVCSPPGRSGDVDQVVLGACELAGASEVYRMGGAQAVAALAHGTEMVPAVDVIVGPGNLYVQEAKRQLSGQVGIDSFAGPSDLLVIADGDSDPGPIALDMLAQGEHGLGTLVVCGATPGALLQELRGRLTAMPNTGAVQRLVEVPSSEYALALAQAFAPEHLELIGPRAEQLADRITRAGCVFVGAASATAFGDYIAGSNHVLPTGGAARFASALSTAHFRRSFTEVRISDATQLALTAAPIARAEGFELHARSMEARIGDD
ncbi:MAG: histidinol dehydrogenase [Solirubrobacteraceae bacterium]